MTTRIAFLGTSHLGAIRLGWDLVRMNYPSVEVSFFGAAGHAFPFLQLMSDNTFGLAPDTDLPDNEIRKIENAFGTRSVSLSGFDTVVFVGLDWQLSQITNICDQMNVDGLWSAGNKRSLSMSAFNAILQHWAQLALPDPAFCNRNDLQVVVAARPIPGENLLQQDGPWAASWKKRSEQGFGRVLDYALDRIVEVCAASGVAFRPQPKSTRAENGMTKNEFNRDQTQFYNPDKPKIEPDFIHMNAQYGALVLDDLLKNIIIATPSGRAT